MDYPYILGYPVYINLSKKRIETVPSSDSLIVVIVDIIIQYICRMQNKAYARYNLHHTY